MAKTRWGTLAGITALALCVGARIQSIQDLFQKALSLERTGGDLKGGIALYKRVVDTSEEEALSAQAQLRIGFCLEKLGLDDARKAFQAVIDRFPKQAGAVRIAREKIADLMNQPSPGSAGGELQIRRIWKGKDLEPPGSLSPNGKEFLSVDWAKGEVMGRDVVSGRIRILATSSQLKGIPSDNLDWPEQWSRDGGKFGIVRRNGTGNIDLGIFDVSTGALRFIYENMRVSFLRIFDWSPDGAHLLVIMRPEKQPSEWATISTADGRINVIKAFDEQKSVVHHAFFSRDGRFVAYDHGYKEDRYNSDIHIISLGDNTEKPGIVHGAFDYVLGWAPDGKSLLFASNRSGTFDVWSSSWDRGVLGPQAQLIKADIGTAEPLSLTERGRLYYSLLVRPQNIMSTEVDFDQGRILTPPVKIGDRFEGSNSLPEMSPDGRYAAFLSVRKPRPSVMIEPLTTFSADTICVYSYEGKPTRAYTLDLDYISLERLQWSPDSRFVHFKTTTPPREVAVYRLNIETGEMKKIYASGDFSLRVISPDGQRGYGIHPPPPRADKKIFLVLTEFAAGLEREFCEIPKPPSFWGVSPDGKFLALSDGCTVDGKTIYGITLTSTAGGEGQIVKRFELDAEIPGQFAQLTWAKDGQSLLYGRIIFRNAGEDYDHFELWRVPISGDPARKIVFLPGDHISWFSFHPGSRRLVYASGPGASCEIWALENFFPKK